MLSSIAFLPTAPVLIPDLAQAAAPETDGIREATDAILASLISTNCLPVIVGDDLGHEVGRYLLSRVTDTNPILIELPANATQAQQLAVVQRIQDISDGSLPVVVIAMGDASACRSPQAPGHEHPSAVMFDDAVLAALSRVDLLALKELDQDLASQLLVAGRSVWPTMAELLQADNRTWVSTPFSTADPYGVLYLVGAWTTD